MADKIKLLSIKDLGKKKFLVPNYQRGYRWDRQQVRDLLEDISEFMDSTSNARDEFYCLQPLVVREKISEWAGFIRALPTDAKNALQKTREAIERYVEWEVIDGQQRLTTIHILLSFLDSGQAATTEFSIRYATREKSCDFLDNITNKTEEAEMDVDFWHMKVAYDAIKEWFGNEDTSVDRMRFRETLLNKVQFIWYESSEDPIKVFTRLNIGKIGLTNSELIKALFLNKSNFSGDDAAKIRLRQIEIATRWDQIEATLQDDEFWMFLHEKGYDKPTRIDFIFDLMCKSGTLDKFIDENFIGSEKTKKLLGNDGYRTFRYFNAFFKSLRAKEECDAVEKSLIEVCWEKVDEIFATFREWFEDLRLYHYVGFLVDQKTEVVDIYNRWLKSNTKTDFLNAYLIPAITEKVAVCRDLDKQYEIEDERGKVVPKTQCRRLLLLHNLQTVINQNTKRSADGRSEVFYKFPFHLYKTEGWDIEHIDSNSTNEMESDETRIEFLANVYSAVSKRLQDEITKFNLSNDNFDELKNKIESELGHTGNEKLLDDCDKNMIWNFAILDSHTNRSYGNAIFSAKRRIIIGKDKGKYISIPRLVKKNGKVEIKPSDEIEAPSSFIPPCTRQVFLKYYSALSSSPNHWTKDDARSYKLDIYETLRVFNVTMNCESGKGE